MTQETGDDLEYRGFSEVPDCDGPADTWMEKMMAKINDVVIVKMIRKDPFSFLIVMPVAFLVAAMFRDPIMAYPSCSARCDSVGAKEYRLEAKYLVLLEARYRESMCACRFENGTQTDMTPGKWNAIDE